LFGPVAAWYVNNILAGAPPPPGMLPADVKGGRRLAYKTGTSYGFRDAWAVGYDREVTIAVWAGRPDGTPMPGSSGRVTAAPILFKIADLLGPAADTAPEPPPSGALLVGRRDLPPRLQVLDPGPSERGAGPDAGGPRILYPPNGATVAWQGGDVPLEASGGKPPFRWLVDGRPLPPAPSRHDMTWQPGGIGYVRLTVVDADGRSGRATVRLEP
jgi:penicillin-binding protein 1C